MYVRNICHRTEKVKVTGSVPTYQRLFNSVAKKIIKSKIYVLYKCQDELCQENKYRFYATKREREGDCVIPHTQMIPNPAAFIYFSQTT